jgi:hypothetical protein
MDVIWRGTRRNSTGIAAHANYSHRFFDLLRKARSWSPPGANDRLASARIPRHFNGHASSSKSVAGAKQTPAVAAISAHRRVIMTSTFVASVSMSET